jgi:hypothetical protein
MDTPNTAAPKKKRGRKPGALGGCSICEVLSILDTSHNRRTCPIYKKAVELFERMDFEKKILYVYATITKNGDRQAASTILFGMNGMRLLEINKRYPEFVKAIYCLAKAMVDSSKP